MSEKSSFGSGSSVAVRECQVCSNKNLHPGLFLGYLPPVNLMQNVGATPVEQPSYPAGILLCETCGLVQLGLNVDARVLFPASYPYTSSTTKVLRDNFSELSQECSRLFSFKKTDLVVDIGSNDGNLLSFFKDKHQVLGITPEDIGKLAVERGIPTLFAYFNKSTVDTILQKQGQASIVTATNVFAHIEDVHEVLRQIKRLLKDDGVFISESHYLCSLLETLQYDTIYHEHLRYYSLHALDYLLRMHDMEVFHAKRIPTHGGSIRVYASPKGKHEVRPSVTDILKAESDYGLDAARMKSFTQQVVLSKLDLLAQLADIKHAGKRIFGISAPSRASTLINYCGIDNGILDCVCEVSGSYKIGKYIPGTLIPVVDEKCLYEQQPEYALLLSWHIADELMPKLWEKGFKGQFIVPLPEPRVVAGKTPR